MIALLLVPSVFAADFPLKSVDVDVQVAGPVADVTVRQVFHNDSKTFMDATYVFPLQPDAAVDGLVMTVADREIRGVVKERDAAKKAYDAAKAQGHAAALTEQERPNVFTQHVANLPPGEDVTVEIHVVEPIVRTDGQWELDIPLVVGPRFLGGTEDPAAISTPVARNDTGVRANLHVHVDAGVPIATFASPTHQGDLRVNGSTATAEIDGATLTRDFVLRWSAQATHPEAVALRQGDHVLVYLEPPAAPPRKDVVPRELVYVIDTSCSMSGAPLQMAKDAMNEAFDDMDARDSFLVLDFDDKVSALAPAPLVATPENIARGREFVNAFVGSGGTDMLSGMDVAMRIPHDANRQRFVAFLTDGYIGNEKDILGRLEDGRGSAHLFSFGLGSGNNRYLLDEMARSGRGKATYVTLKEDPKAAVKAFLDTIDKPVLTDISVDWGTPNVDAWPKASPDLFAGQPMWVTAEVPQNLHQVTVTGRLGSGSFRQQIPIVDASTVGAHGIGTLYARAKIGDLERQQHWGEIPEVKQEIVDTALKYQLLTHYTSFLAIDHKIVNRTGVSHAVDVPVDIPDGVQYDAAVSREYTPPGDPLLVVDAPEDARAVVALFPWGERVYLRWDGLRKRWFYRFLVPRDVADGDYDVQVFTIDAQGRASRRVKTLHVDSEAPELSVGVERTTAGSTRVTVFAEEPLRRLEIEPVGHPELRATLDVQGDAWNHTITLPGVWEEVTVVAKDRAMNTIVTSAYADDVGE